MYITQKLHHKIYITDTLETLWRCNKPACMLAVIVIVITSIVAILIYLDISNDEKSKKKVKIIRFIDSLK